jgi:serine/threonine protein kinase
MERAFGSTARARSSMHRGLESAAGIREGDILAGKYRVERVLGAGGMGVVVAAHHIPLDERVALKFLLPEAVGNSDAIARFTREARAAVKIKSEHVARIIDVGTLANGAPFIVMEYLDGGDLAAWLKQRGVLPIEQAVDFVLQACVAVADAHALGIVHRDLKPANLFCVRRSDGQLSIKVLDFGISKMIDRNRLASGPGTRTAAVMGSPLYMSPEQMRSAKDVDAQTDLWALGVILFELMTGRAPFLGDTVTELAIKVAHEPAPAIRTFRPDVPIGLEAVVSRCLQKDRRQRYGNVAELAVALLEFGPKRARVSVERITGILQSAGLSASALALPPSPQPGVATRTVPETVAPVGRTASTLTRGKTAALSLVGVVAVSAAGGTALWFARRSAVLPSTTTAIRSSPTTATASGTPEVTISSLATVPPAPGPPAPQATIVAAAMALPAAPLVPVPVVGVRAKPHGAEVQVPGPATLHAGSPGRSTVPASAPSAASPAPTAPPSKPPPNCNPPYVIDSAGHRQYKPECP